MHRMCAVKVDYIGMDVEDKFIVGYGMDYNQQYRSMPCIGVLKPEVYQKKEEPISETAPAVDTQTQSAE